MDDRVFSANGKDDSAYTEYVFSCSLFVQGGLIYNFRDYGEGAIFNLCRIKRLFDSDKMADCGNLFSVFF